MNSPSRTLRGSDDETRDAAASPRRPTPSPGGRPGELRRDTLDNANEEERRWRDEAREGLVEGLALIADRLGHLESRLAEGAVEVSRPTLGVRPRLEPHRLPPEDGGRPAGLEETLGGLDRRLAELGRRLDADERAEVGAGEEGARGPAVQPGAGPAGETTAQRFAALHTTLDAISEQLDVARESAGERAEQQRAIMRQVEALRRDVEEMSRSIGDLAPRASVAAIETALRDLAFRVDSQRGRGVASDLLAPAERIAGELRAAIKELDPSPIVRNLHADVRTIGRRLDALQAPGGADAAAIKELAGQAREIKQQLAALASRPLPLEKIETRLLDLSQRVEALSFKSAGTDKAAAALDMGELVRSIRAIVRAETGGSFETFNRRLEQLAGKLDEAVARAGGKRFEELGERIEALGKTLAQRIEKSAAQKPVDTAPLEQLIAKLGRKIDAALETKPHAPAFEEIGRKIDRLETRFADPAADKRYADLAHRIDLVQKTLAQRLEQGSSADLRHIEELVGRLDNKVETALSEGSKNPDLQGVESQLAQLSSKVDRLDDPSANARLGEFLARPVHNPQLDEISQRLERMQAALAQRAAEGAQAEARQNDLASAVEQLAERMNQALDPRDDAGALKSLESQIRTLSERLERDDQNGAALAAVETRIGALMAQIEETRAATTQAAEEAVRRATQEILRQAAPAPAALREALERELTDIRKVQDESGQRTQDTLRAVHETLERVVNRLELFEDEISEMRAGVPLAPPAVSLASGVGVTSPRRQNGAALREPELRRERREPDFRTLASAAGQEGRPSAASLQTDFIAAARRAAQQAALDAEAAARAQQNSRRAGVRGDDAGEEAGEGASGAMSSVGSALLARKRPLLLGIGALVLLVGAYQVARISIQGVEPFAGNPSQERQAGEPAAPAAEAPAAKEPAAKEPAPPASQGSAPPPRMISPPRVETAPPQKPAERAAAIAPLVDPTPIGGIPAGVSPPSAPDAIALVRSQALQGQAAAQYEMGVRYADGRGVGRDGAVAAQWLEKAASQGLAPAQYRLGSLYEKGVGVERDLGRARQLYQTAATAGNARAMHNLAVLLAEGGDGGKPDYASASEWFRRAAEYGVRDSQYNLAILYARGLGVDQNLTQSYLWFSAAADQGDADAARKRDEVGARLDSKELAAAKALAAGFHAKEPLREANDVLPPTGGWGGAKDPAGAGRPAQKPSAKAKFSAI